MTKPRDYNVPPPWLPAPYDAKTVSAIKALANGEANDGQQKIALNWIINAVCGAYDVSFRDDRDGGDRATSFAEGKRSAGLQIVKLINMSGAVLDEIRRKDG